MFYLMGVIQQEFRLKITWNYLEGGHGAADGGAAIESEADKMVAHGTDISDAMKLYAKVIEDSKSQIKFFYVNRLILMISCQWFQQTFDRILVQC